MEYLGYIAALLIGISLGLIGGGGSILTVPVLVYFFGLNPVLATSYSLFVVGLTSLSGTINKLRFQLVDLRTTFLFGLSSVTVVFIIRKWVIPAIPEMINLGFIHVSFALLTLLVFALLMVLAAVSMLRSKAVNTVEKAQHKKYGPLLLYGVLIGLVTGFLGAGGGFLLVPALVLLVQLPMQKAVGTSLSIIAINSSIGFLGDLGNFNLDWQLLLLLSALAIAGVFIGTRLGKKIDGQKLKKGFAFFVLIMGTFIIVKELFFS